MLLNNLVVCVLKKGRHFASLYFCKVTSLRNADFCVKIPGFLSFVSVKIPGFLSFVSVKIPGFECQNTGFCCELCIVMH